MRLPSWAINYFEKAKNFSTLHFILEMTTLAFLLKMVAVLIFGIIFGILGLPQDPSLDFEESLLKLNFAVLVAVVVVFASFETLTGQWLVIFLTSKFTSSMFWKIFISSVVFSTLHVEPFLVAIVFPIGVILAWVFIIKRKEGRWKAFWITTAVHSLHNLVATGLLWLSVR